MTAERWVPIVEVSEAGLPNFLEQKKKDGFFLIGLEQTANSFSIDEFTFPKKVVSCSLSLSPPPTWVSSVNDHKVELVSFSSVGAVMDHVFLALDQGLAKVSWGPNVLSSVGWVSISLISTGSCF